MRRAPARALGSFVTVAAVLSATGSASEPGTICINKWCTLTCTPNATRRWGNCCDNRTLCEYDVVFQDNRCIPPAPNICAGPPSPLQGLASAAAQGCRDRRLWPFSSNSIWNTPIGSEAVFVQAGIFPDTSDAASMASGADQCANMTAHPAQRSTCPGVHAGVTPSECAAKGCCFSATPTPDPHHYPWCFTKQHRYGPNQFHSDPDYFVAVKESDPWVPWVLQGWWGGQPPPGAVNCSQANCWCHCNRLPSSKVYRQIQVPHNWTTDQNHPSNGGTAILQADNVTVLQMQPTYRCSPGSPVLSLRQGCPSPYPENVSILGDGIAGAHGGSGLSALGGVIRSGELSPAAPPIAHALKLELYAHRYYFGLHPLQNTTEANGGRTQYVWPATGSDSYTWADGSPLRYNGTNPHLVPGALLAIPTALAGSVNVTTTPGERIKQALTYYGGYLVDDTASDSAAICTEAVVLSEFQEQ